MYTASRILKRPGIGKLAPFKLRFNGVKQLRGFTAPFTTVITDRRLRQFPEDGFKQIYEPYVLEEETTPGYKAEKFYPVRLGEVLGSKFQVLAKLGYGTASTAWLCRDLDQDVFRTIKVCIIDTVNNELSATRHLEAFMDAEHPGKNFLRLVIDSFEVIGPYGVHQCLVFKPLGMNYTDFKSLFREKRLDQTLVRKSLQVVLIGLDFIHQAGLAHTDLSPNNILQGANCHSVFSEMEEAELKNPSARKILNDRIIYSTKPIHYTADIPLISDFGASRIGETHKGDVMPHFYRAPEILMDMEWNSKIDIWSIGCIIWDLFEGTRLFRAVKAGHLNDEQHLAEMVSLMGSPPRAFLERSPKCQKYWDEEGNWIAETKIPDQSLESRECRLEGKDREILLDFVRRIFRWLPEERASAEELFKHEFIERPDSEQEKNSVGAE